MLELPRRSHFQKLLTTNVLLASGRVLCLPLLHSLFDFACPQKFANDTLMDVLYFMTPEHHDVIIDIVVKEMNTVVQKFRALTGYQGDVSLIGHSLGSVISWDILKDQIPRAPLYARASSTYESKSEDVEKQSDPAEAAASSDGRTATSLRGDDETLPTVGAETSSSGTSIRGVNSRESTEQNERARSEQQTASNFPQLSFDVEHAFMLGSPIAVFLMIRNQEQPLRTNYRLNGCARVFNIFHPYDPVAYRIEPLLDPRNADIEPKIMTHCRLQRLTRSVLS
jgi:phospholipase DDHD2